MIDKSHRLTPEKPVPFRVRITSRFVEGAKDGDLGMATVNILGQSLLVRLDDGREVRALAHEVEDLGEPVPCQRCGKRPADGSRIMCQQCWVETGDRP